MIEFRSFKLDDLIPLCGMLEWFTRECDIPTSPNVVLNTASIFITEPHCFALLMTNNDVPVGFWLGFLDVDPWDGQTIALERAVWIHPAHRQLENSNNMRKLFEAWAENVGAKRVWIHATSSKDNDTLAWGLCQVGYQKKGSNLMKQL